MRPEELIQQLLRGGGMPQQPVNAQTPPFMPAQQAAPPMAPPAPQGPDPFAMLMSLGQQQAQPEAPKTKRQQIGMAIGDFLTSIGAGLSNRGKAGQSTGAGAAMQTPFILAQQRQQQAQQQQMMQQAQQKLKYDQMLQAINARTAQQNANTSQQQANTAAQPKPPEPFTLGQGQQRFGPNGEPIASVPAAPTAPRPRQTSVVEGVLVDNETGEAIYGTKKTNEPTTPFQLWLKQHPNGTSEQWASSQAASDGTSGSITLSPEALEITAKRYLQDGTLPPMGMGGAASEKRSQIINRAAQIDPQASIAANKAEFDANRSALIQMQRSADAVTAFEKTAKKNLDLFIGAARKVKDSGSPWINRGLRSVDRNALGSAEQAAYDAARQVAFVEIARVVANPNLTGVLSDNARQEMEKVLSGDATLAQTLKVSELLTQDMDNRKASISEQLGEIQSRMRKGALPTVESPAQMRARLASAQVGDIVDTPNGKMRKTGPATFEAVGP